MIDSALESRKYTNMQEEQVEEHFGEGSDVIVVTLSLLRSKMFNW